MVPFVALSESTYISHDAQIVCEGCRYRTCLHFVTNKIQQNRETWWHHIDSDQVPSVEYEREPILAGQSIHTIFTIRLYISRPSFTLFFLSVALPKHLLSSRMIIVRIELNVLLLGQVHPNSQLLNRHSSTFPMRIIQNLWYTQVQDVHGLDNIHSVDIN